MSKILSHEMKEGIITKIQDDIVIGGDTQTQCARNYIRVLNKLDLANLCVKPQKVSRIRRNCWLDLEEGRNVVCLPIQEEFSHKHAGAQHNENKTPTKLPRPLQNTPDATPGVSGVLTPIEEAVAGRNSNNPLEWTHSLSQRFKEAKSHIKHTHTIYLPHPDDQLVIKTDAASLVPIIGHTIYAVKDNELVPV